MAKLGCASPCHATNLLLSALGTSLPVNGGKPEWAPAPYTKHRIGNPIWSEYPVHSGRATHAASQPPSGASSTRALSRSPAVPRHKPIPTLVKLGGPCVRRRVTGCASGLGDGREVGGAFAGAVCNVPATQTGAVSVAVTVAAALHSTVRRPGLSRHSEGSAASPSAAWA
jgi:hypothetical protein